VNSRIVCINTTTSCGANTIAPQDFDFQPDKSRY
jgi:hypothetical protein